MVALVIIREGIITLYDDEVPKGQIGRTGNGDFHRLGGCHGFGDFGAACMTELVGGTTILKPVIMIVADRDARSEIREREFPVIATIAVANDEIKRLPIMHFKQTPVTGHAPFRDDFATE